MRVRTSTPEASVELRPLTEVALVPLLGFGVLVSLLAEFTAAPDVGTGIGLVTLALTGVVWILSRSRPALAAGSAILGTTTLLFGVAYWMREPVALGLLGLPVGLAVAAAGTLAAVCLALTETALVVTLGSASPAQSAPMPTVLAVISIWSALATFSAFYRHVATTERWLNQYLERFRDAVAEARDQRAELGRAMRSVMHLNRQLVLVNERLGALRIVAEEARQAKAAFVARVSHELRTPLNMIIGLVRLMVESPELYSGPFPPDLVEDLRVVHRNSEHLLDMVNDVLDLSQMEAGRGKLYREWVSVTDIVQVAADAIQPLIDNKHLYLKLTVPDELPAVNWDRARILQVILNLLSNAARFTEQGGITIRAGQRDSRVCIEVHDTGAGIAPDLAQRLFEPFYQGGPIWIEKGGTGLGLSICKQLVTLHGGRIWVESEPGAGATVSFELPISDPEPLEVNALASIKEDWVWHEHAFRTDDPGLQHELLQKRVIVCDESGDICRELAPLSDQVQFVHVSDLQQALDAQAECPAHAVMITGCNPAAVRDRMERVAAHAVMTPVVGACIQQPKLRATEAGVSGYLVKPVTREALHRVLGSCTRTVRRVLLVDDSLDFLQLLSRTLLVCDSRLEVLTASSGARALARLRQEQPDLMLLDLVMPEMDGWEVLAEKKQDEAICGIPTVIISARDPVEQPTTADAFWATLREELSLRQLAQCTLGFARMVSEERIADPARASWTRGPEGRWS